MQELFKNEVVPPKMLVVGVETDGFFDFIESLKEIKELCQNLGGEVAGVITQKRQGLQPATCIGEGKIAEISEYCKNNDIAVIVFDLELSPAQLKNLSSALPDFDIIDRTMVILDIFAMRANTAEGKIQVELAKMKYALPRLKGSYTSLSRIGGGIGTRRGLGESKLELDRRHISERIDALKEEIRELQKRRSDLRLRRKKDDVLCVALAGYTNSGKSTLLNALTKADVLVEDKLFATLDPTSRALKLPDNQEILLIDTVGFMRRLPHHLIDAFKSTLEEIIYADLVLTVCDISDNDYKNQLAVTQDMLKSLKYDGQILTVYNKIDKLEKRVKKIFKPTDSEIYISAKTGENLDALLQKIQGMVSCTVIVDFLIPYKNYELLSFLNKNGKIIKEEHTKDGVKVKAQILEKWAKKYAGFTV